MSQAIDSTTLARFFNQGEADISQQLPFILDRQFLVLTAGQGVYTLPDYIWSINRVTYMGNYLDPLNMRNFREVFQTSTQTGTPFWYIYNNVGLNQIQLFPAPPANIAAGTDPWNSNTDILNTCIIEYARVADNVNFILPMYLRREMLKRFVAYKIHLMEGPLHDLDAAEYYEKQWSNWVKMFRDHLYDMHEKPRKLQVDEIVSNIAYPAPPILPVDRFGISVDDGY